ncbi:hypothetical protein BT69DRAFT_1327704 [Atractiella rhizophila]|nr:hypothetical protein BT69DRAFT_1327704 [Atractiella rhizophila]
METDLIPVLTYHSTASLPLASAKRLDDVLDAFKGVLTQLAMWNDHDFIHRDVSYANIFIREFQTNSDDGNAPAVGWLNDFDLSIRREKNRGKHASKPHPLSGTFLFLSRCVLKALKKKGASYEQSLMDDIESVIYCCIYFFCNFYPDATGRLVRRDWSRKLDTPTGEGSGRTFSGSKNLEQNVKGNEQSSAQQSAKSAKQRSSTLHSAKSAKDRSSTLQSAKSAKEQSSTIHSVESVPQNIDYPLRPWLTLRSAFSEKLLLLNKPTDLPAFTHLLSEHLVDDGRWNQDHITRLLWELTRPLQLQSEDIVNGIYWRPLFPDGCDEKAVVKDIVGKMVEALERGKKRFNGKLTKRKKKRGWSDIGEPVRSWTLFTPITFPTTTRHSIGSARPGLRHSSPFSAIALLFSSLTPQRPTPGLGSPTWLHLPLLPAQQKTLQPYLPAEPPPPTSQPSLTTSSSRAGAKRKRKVQSRSSFRTNRWRARTKRGGRNIVRALLKPNGFVFCYVGQGGKSFGTSISIELSGGGRGGLGGSSGLGEEGYGALFPQHPFPASLPPPLPAHLGKDANPNPTTRTLARAMDPPPLRRNSHIPTRLASIITIMMIITATTTITATAITSTVISSFLPAVCPTSACAAQRTPTSTCCFELAVATRQSFVSSPLRAGRSRMNRTSEEEEEEVNVRTLGFFHGAGLVRRLTGATPTLSYAAARGHTSTAPRHTRPSPAASPSSPPPSPLPLDGPPTQGLLPLEPPAHKTKPVTPISKPLGK